MRTSIFKSCLLFFFSIACYTQELPKVIPLNPEVSAFGKYMDTPVGVETGVPNISVPLVNLKAKGLSIPISLSYHSGGIRVSEIASRVGLGWNLNAGGAVIRNVRGNPDDSNIGYFNPLFTVQEFKNMSHQQRVDNVSTSGPENFDLESDIYSFNFLGQSGKFFFRQVAGGGKELIMIHKKDVKIEIVGTQKILGWIITDANGVRYYLGKSKDGSKESINTTTTYNRSNGTYTNLPTTAMNNYTNAWQLMEIETPSGELITYNYSLPTLSSYINVASQDRHIPTGSGGTSSIQPVKYVQNEDYYRRLNSISSTNGTVELVYDNTQRQDLNNDYALKEVKLFDDNDKLIDAYTLTHSYFVSTENHNPVTLFGDLDQRRKRLYLQDIKQTINSITNKEWSFEYHTTHILPDRFSFAQDFWGFYNGEPNTVFYPTIAWRTGSGVLTNLIGAERRVNETYAQACTLKKIIHPTGGSTEFGFESNRVFNLPFFGTTDMTSQYIDGLSSVGLPDDYYIKIFTINLDNYPGGISWLANLTSTCTDPNGIECPRAKLSKYDGSQYVLLSQTNGQDIQQDIPLSETGNVQFKIEITDFSGMGGGFFGGGTPNDVVVSVSGYGLPPGSGNDAYTGGIRVKNILTKDSDGTPISQKDYLYTKFTNSNESSGLALNPPTFIYKNIPDCNSSTGNLIDKLSSNSIYALTSGSPYTTYYTNVTELLDNGNGGKTEFTNKFEFDGQEVQTNVFVNGGNAGYEGVNTPAHDFAHRRGLPLSTKHIGNDLGSFNAKQETTSKYADGGKEYGTNFVFMQGGCYTAWAEYTTHGERYFKTEDGQITYDGSNELTQTTTYSYDSGYFDRSFPIETKTTVSDDDPIITKTYYPDDVTSTSSLGIDNLTIPERDAIYRLKKEDLHRIVEPIQVNTYKDRDNDGVKDASELISVQRTNYNNATNPLPNDIQTLKGIYNSSTNILQDRLEFHSYYANGNVREVSKKDGSKIVYIWGYNEQYPIAKIENADFIDIPTTTYNDIIAKSNLDDSLTDEDNLRTSLNNLRNVTALSGALITTFTYDPQIGITSVTDAMGQTIYYQYDQFNRLEYITDKDGKVVSKNEYHYQN